MKFINFENRDAQNLDQPLLDTSQLQWVDFCRNEKLELGAVEKLIHRKHHEDLLNGMHPPFYELTDSYEIIVFRTIDDRFQIIQPRTRSTAFLIIENTVISIHDGDDITLTDLYEKWSASKSRRPSNVLSLFHDLTDEIVNVFLRLREPLNNQVSEWQRKLLDPNDPFNDWHIIMLAKSSLRSLNSNMELQKEVLINWKENTRYVFSSAHIIKFNDLHEHLARVGRLSEGLKTDLDSLTQIYFASTGQKTNINVQLLAVISAIFLPLNLIAGIFGMNFDSIPLLKNPMGVFIVVGFMVSMSAILLWVFKKKSWY
jgi:Mg2+ and Co2+ transporter CorA